MSDHPTIGASQISAILGIHPWLTQHDVWKQLVHGVKQEDNEALQRGREWEPDILAKYQRLTKLAVNLNSQQLPIHRGYLHATPDAFAFERASVGDRRNMRLVEAKTSAVAWNTLPAYYYNQVQVQLYCWQDFASADVAVMFSFFGFKIFEGIKPDPNLQQQLHAAAEKFIKDYVLTKKLPPIDHTEACRGAIIAQWPTQQSETYLDSDPTIDMELILPIMQDEALKAVAVKRIDERKNALRALIGDHAGFKSNLARVDFKYQNGRQTTDYEEILRALKPKLSKANLKRLDKLLLMHTKKSGSRQLRIYWNKGGDDDQAAAQITDSVRSLGDSQPADEPQG